MRYRLADDRGATAVLVAASLFMIMGFAALVVDIGAGMNERRQDQSSADVAALAGAVEARLLGDVEDIVVEALNYVETNLDTSYGPVEWETLWLGCTDPEKSVAPLDVYQFQAVATPSSWTSVGTIDCISISPFGYFRVVVPEQIVPTTFGKVLGVTQFKIDAAAISRLTRSGIGGILPFGLASDVGDGEHSCLSSAPTGLADDPCVGSDSGNFGTLKGRVFGSPDLGIAPNCNSSPLSDVLAMNIAAGLDHWVTLDDDGLAANEVRDECFNPGVDTLNTDTGFPNNGAEEGLATGPISYGFTPRLQQGPNSKLDIAGNDLDNKPLWEYLLGVLQDVNPLNDGAVPVSCGGFNDSLSDGVYDWDGGGPDPASWDWDGDGTDDLPESWEHMAACLEDYDSGGHTALLFGLAIQQSPRFAYVPQFFEPDLGTGSDWLHVRNFKAVFIQGTWWKRSAVDIVAFHPGEPCPGCNNTAYSMTQLSAFVLADSALPEILRADPPPGESGGPYKGVELWK